MERHLNEVFDKARHFDIPIAVAGDIFHSWKSPIELVNWTISMFRSFGKIIAIPGQHDLPYHERSQIGKSAYQTLVAANAIHDLIEPIHKYGLRFHPFEWNKQLKSIEGGTAVKNLAVVHRYVWKDRKGSYPGAPEENRIDKTVKQLKGYDALLFGDNHIPFYDKATNLYNHGTFIRQTVADKKINPGYGILYDDASIEVYEMESPKQDKWDDAFANLGTNVNNHYDQLLSLLNEGNETLGDFVDQINKYMTSVKIEKEVKELILKALEDK